MVAEIIHEKDVIISKKGWAYCDTVCVSAQRGRSLSESGRNYLVSAQKGTVIVRKWTQLLKFV